MLKNTKQIVAGFAFIHNLNEFLLPKPTIGNQVSDVVWKIQTQRQKRS